MFFRNNLHAEQIYQDFRSANERLRASLDGLQVLCGIEKAPCKGDKTYLGTIYTLFRDKVLCFKLR